MSLESGGLMVAEFRLARLIANEIGGGGCVGGGGGGDRKDCGG